MPDHSATPAHRVPYDVLVEIFHAATDSDVYEIGQGPQALTVLKGVCKGWRNAAIGCPSLWSRLLVHIGSRYFDLVEMYLRRSRDCPLSIQLDADMWWTLSDCPTGIPRNKRRYDLDGVQRMLSLLAEHSDRFSTLRLTGSAWPRLMPFSRFRGRLSRLEILELTRECSGLLETGQFQIAPKLHTIRTPGSHLTGTAADSERPWLDIPRAQIRSLDISRPYDMAGAGDDRILQLEAFPNLSSLTLDFEAYGSDAIQTMSGNPSVRFTLHRLSYWKIQVASKLEVPQLGWMMDHFKTPALGTLHITYFTEPSNLCDLLRRSQCSLKRLVLQRCAIRVGDLLSILELAPSLDSLVIDNGSIPTMVTDKFFQGLTLDSGGRTIAPVLRELRIFNGGKVLEMLESRVGHDLAVVQLVLSQDALKDSDAERLRSYAGIHVSLDCVPARPYADL